MTVLGNTSEVEGTVSNTFLNDVKISGGNVFVLLMKFCNHD